MPSGLLLGGALRGRTRNTSGSFYVKAEEISDKEISVNETGVTLRDRKTGADSPVRGDAQLDLKRQDWRSNKRNATYLNEEEYDEDLAQLDVLLHYVNNLSASLEFLRWEDKRISTDLVPTLLNMYDALYARLSEASRSPSRNDVSSAGNEDLPRRARGCGSGNDTKENIYDNELFIREDDVTSSKDSSDTKGLAKCKKCGDDEVKKRLCVCSLPSYQNGSGSGSSSYRTFHDNLDTRLPVENDYDIPESIEKPPDDLSGGSYNNHSGPSQNGFLNKSGLKLNPCVDKALKGRQLTLNKDNSSPLVPKRGRDLLYRPLSSISSTSSSSSSSNSLPRVLGGTLPSYLASAESLNENEAHRATDAETSRRRDRGLKARREKALRAGSDDSGVQCHSISLPAPPTLRPRYCDPNLNYLDRVVLEIVETEEIYVRDLKEVIEGYINHWRSSADACIPSDVIDTLFSNIEHIFNFNKKFLSELEICGTDPVLVAKCFVRNNSGFAIYTDYCTNYPRTVSVLTDLMREERSVRACRERQLALGHTLPLGSYLLKPVQRVLKYHLLLGNIVKHFEKDRPGYTHIWNALSAMTGIAHHINDMKRKHEHAVRVQEIQSLLYGWEGEDLTTYGELAAEGTFRMFGFKGLRHVFLFDKMLLIAKKKDENILVYKAHILCSDLMLIESIPREPLSFHVIPFDNPRRQYTLECRNLEQKREWTLQLKRVILENYSATIPAHARQLVMELGQAKPNDLSATESRGGGGRRAHCAPEYLEKRKDKRRASEVGLGFNSKLRLRRSSRSRKEKATEKENRSRSASRNRETDEDEEHKSRVTSPAPSTHEKSRLKLPMWRRRSEPGVRGKIGLSISTPEKVIPKPSQEVVKEDKLVVADESPLLEQNAPSFRRLSSTEVANDSVDPGECDLLYDCDDNDEVAGENLEHIVSQLLQHQLQVQQKILNKQRRGIIRKNKVGLQYETSDTENDEDVEFECRPPLPTSPPPMDTGPLSFNMELIDLIFNQPEKEDQGAEWSSEAASICSSTNSTHRRGSIDSNARSTSVSRSGSDIGSKAHPQIQRANYDNLLNVWGHSKSSCVQRSSSRDSCLKENISNLAVVNENFSSKSGIRRVLSFSNEIITNDSQNIHGSHKNFSVTKEDCSRLGREENVDKTERPATIAIYDQTVENFDALQLYLNQNENCNKKNKPIPDIVNKNVENCNGNSQFSKNSQFTLDNMINIHPEHKIYSKASVNKKIIKRVLHKLANLRSTPNKSMSEPSHSLSNISISNEFDKSMIRRSSVLVSSMARQCSRNLKERIKQIRTEDLDSPTKVSSPEPVYAVPSYKQVDSCIGARLALPNELDYAIPTIRSNEGSKNELRPDSVISSFSVWTSSSSSNSSNREVKGDIKTNSGLGDNALEEKDTAAPSVGSDVSGDSFYEKSFEAIEAYLLEDEMFRDSAIYSEAEDGDTLTPGSSFRSGTLSPKPSFRKSPRNHDNRITPRKLTLASSKSLDGSFLNALEPPSPVNLTNSTSILDQKSPSLTPKKVPPPVPAKPEITTRKLRSKGTLIQQQLKNLEDSQKLVRDDSLLKDLEGITSLNERREQLKTMSEKRNPERESLSPCSPKMIQYGHRNVSFDDSVKFSPAAQGFSYSPHVNSSSIQNDESEPDETVMSKGWVKHVIGKLQQ